MIQFTYGRPAPAMSNTERQRKFRARHPGYYARKQATRRASARRGAEWLTEARRVALVAVLAVERDALSPADSQPVPVTDPGAVAPTTAAPTAPTGF